METRTDGNLGERYVGWLLRQRQFAWTIWFYAVLGAAVVAFGLSLSGRNIEAAVHWSILGFLMIVGAQVLLVLRHARSIIDRLEGENAELRTQLGRG